MKAFVPWVGALLCAAATATLAQADPCYLPCRQAPSTCGPGFYVANPCGACYGPCYWLRPPWEPFNGMVPGGQPGYPGYPGPGGPGTAPAGHGVPPVGPGMAPLGPGMAPGVGIAGFPSHPFARSPRDFFMMD